MTVLIGTEHSLEILANSIHPKRIEVTYNPIDTDLFQLKEKKLFDSISVFLDSELLVRQLTGKYRVKDKDLKPLYERIKKLAGEFEEIKFSHVRREENKEADKLVNKELDKHSRY